ncbi:hypothetical protein L207DRAFT_533180 [Hyaloscypha variabilis F]|uniref:Uncharacterized protein n=1 Tax=Hyaloscypha variabilis (strain UAMH 11265 / GT02V1 / F) TaxID=1149755 RepID=A0A2J6RCT1_HYAVF|nr:hypothetical protein L207DRAFT_533180 [Hyaloscypha variabilis F]
MGLQLSRAFSSKFEMMEAHPSNWDLSLGYCDTASGAGFPKTNVIMFLACRNKHGKMFVIKIDYTFRVSSADPSPSFQPEEAILLAAPLPTNSQYPSLMNLLASSGAAVLASGGVPLGVRLAWQEGMVLERVEACEVNGEIRAGFTQRLYLDTSQRNDWKIDIINVDDLNT